MTLYRFSKSVTDYVGDASADEAKAFLGGKGAGLTLMSQKGLPVPPGFIIPCEVCREYLSLTHDADRTLFIGKLLVEVAEELKWLKGEFGYMPLLSVRSGAPVSMPGMMDTVLNVGLTTGSDKPNAPEWRERIGERAMLDSRRRLIQMLGETGYGVPKEVFDFQLARVKKAANVKADTDLDAGALLIVGDQYLAAFEKHKGFAFPFNKAGEQLRVAIEAVFRSWQSPRAIEYRKLNGISVTMGTAVVVQAMVFGNMGDDSGSGVLFTRNPATGENFITGEYLANAQGEDVVAGIRTPKSLKKISEEAHEYGEPPNWLGELGAHCDTLEALYNDMVDVEFTVQDGELFILQSRVGKRTARAALVLALQFLDANKIGKDDVFKRITRGQYKVLSRPVIDPAFAVPAHAQGIPACPGVATGRIVLTSEEAAAALDPVILVRDETSPDDIAGMAKAAGILTRSGGSTSHAAVVARAMDKPCVVGALNLPTTKLGHFKKATIDGATGRAWFDLDVPIIDASETEEVLRLQRLAFERAGCGGVLLDLEGTSQADRLLIELTRWWGDYSALDTIMSNLTSMGSCENITLSLVPPSRYANEDDETLSRCFGSPKGTTFVRDAVELIGANVEKLSGLTVVVAAESKALSVAGALKFSKHGVTVCRYTDQEIAGMKFMPTDYAVFTGLAG